MYLPKGGAFAPGRTYFWPKAKSLWDGAIQKVSQLKKLSVGHAAVALEPCFDEKHRYPERRGDFVLPKAVYSLFQQPLLLRLLHGSPNASNRCAAVVEKRRGTPN